MDWDHIEEQLGVVLQAPVRRGDMALKDWNDIASELSGQPDGVRSVVKDQVVYFRLDPAGPDKLDVLSVEEVLITPSEKRLLEMLLEAGGIKRKPVSKQDPPAGEEERRALMVKEWLLRMLEAGEVRADMPELLAAQLNLHSPKIPFLLYGDYSDQRSVTHRDLKRLLESFFEAEIVLIPLMEKEWLILGAESLLTASREDEREDADDESMEEALTSLCSGLYEMLESEWVGECHLTIHDPMTPAKSLLSTVQEMRETIMLGKRYNVGSNLHFPWQVHMERLLYSVPDADKARFVERVLKGIDHVLDAETLSTLEQFFALDCNVSETAKKLYIHRNTLLYRLDKFKQETGKDVRTFSDAVLVKTAILLYKVTKRK